MPAPRIPGTDPPCRCAWRITMLPTHAAYVHQHPGLLVATPEDDIDVLATASADAADLPLMLGVAEPAFARQLPQAIATRMAALRRDYVDVLCLWVTDTAELKSGGLLQTLFGLRDAGRVGHVGLATGDVRSAEWLALNTAARLLVLPWSRDDQAARYRAGPTAREYGMACLTLSTSDDLSFLLGAATHVLPVLDRPVPHDVQPLTPEQVEAAWSSYQATHAPPAPLPRSRPPEHA